MHIPVYGEEHTFLDKETGLLYRNSSFRETASLHTHNFFEFFIVVDGTALHMVNGTIATLARGDLVFIRPQDTHTYEFYYSEDFRIINVGFSRSLFQEIRRFLNKDGEMRRLTNAPLPPCVRTEPGAGRDLIRAFKSIGARIKGGNPQHTTLHAQCYLASVFADYFFCYAGREQEGGRQPVWFDKLLLEMDKIENLQEGLPRMLELAACSQNHLCRVFQETLATTPTAYINDKRLEYAVYFLTQSGDEILEISERCGFHNLSHFYHLFQRKYQSSPAKFRRQQTTRKEKNR
ncbi:MAG: AraC family transcriptional regulator [Lachnospiraceae bacterium]|nr:AraC family transcriptional regulator [Lachnospiraceae bacterium]